MRPAHRNFRGTQSVMASKVQQFGVEAEALDGLLFEDNGAWLPHEGLKAALRIYERQAENGANDEVENDAGIFAKDGLTNGDEAAVQSARTNSNLVIRKSGKEFVRLFNRRGEIGVGEENDAALCFQHAAAHTVALATVFIIAQNTKLRDFPVK